MTCGVYHLSEDSPYGCLALSQGESLNYLPGRCLTFILTGDNITPDLTSATPVGAITSDYVDNQPTVFATFTFSPLLYGTFLDGAGTSRTGIAIAPKLSFEQAKAIPIPNKPWVGIDGAVVGKNCWLYEIRLVLDDGTTAIDVVPPSYVQITGRAAA